MLNRGGFLFLLCRRDTVRTVWKLCCGSLAASTVEPVYCLSRSSISERFARNDLSISNRPLMFLQACKTVA